MNKGLKSSFLLLLTAFIWGSAFVAQSVGMEYIKPCTFLCIRSLLGAVVLIPVMLFMKIKVNNSKGYLKAGFICGIILCISSLLQQYGIMYTTVGKAGFITALYIIIVPLMGLAFRRKPHKILWLCVALAIIGLYFLCINEKSKFSFGDVLVFLCAVGFAFHIMAVDYFCGKYNGVVLSVIQYTVCGVVCIIPMLLLDSPKISYIIEGWRTVAYAGILSTGVGYTLQIIAQKNVNPTTASLIMSMESVFAVISGWVLINQKLSEREIFGCALMLCAIILSQIQWKKQ